MPTIRRTLRRATGRQARGLAEQLQFFRAVIDTIPNCIFVKSREGRYILVNKALAGWRGLMVAEFEGKLDSEINPDAEQVAKFQRDDREVMDTLEEKFVPEEKLINRAGACMWVQTIKRPLTSPGGTARQVLGVLTDITGHKRTEAVFELDSGELAGGRVHQGGQGTAFCPVEQGQRGTLRLQQGAGHRQTRLRISSRKSRRTFSPGRTAKPSRAASCWRSRSKSPRAIAARGSCERARFLCWTRADSHSACWGSLKTSPSARKPRPSSSRRTSNSSRHRAMQAWRK